MFIYLLECKIFKLANRLFVYTNKIFAFRSLLHLYMDSLLLLRTGLCFLRNQETKKERTPIIIISKYGGVIQFDVISNLMANSMISTL